MTAAGSTPNINAVLPALEANQASPEFGRFFIDPVTATTRAGEVTFLNTLINSMTAAILGNEYAGAISVPTGTRALNVLQHVLDSAANDLPGAYQQAYSGNYLTSREPLDAFTCYGAKTTHGAPKFINKKFQALQDNLDGSGQANVKKPSLLCAPASHDGSSVVDSATHLEAYRIGGVTPVHPHTVVTVTDRFGTVSVNTIKPDYMLVPSAKALGAPAPAQTGGVGVFKCYKAEATTPFTRTTATLADQFGSRLYDVIKPLHLCLAANYNAGGLRNPTTDLVCYRVRAAQGQPAHVPVVNQIHTNNVILADDRIDTTREKELCVPGLRTPEPTWQEVVRNSLDTIAASGIPADSARPNSTYRHPLAALFPSLVFEPTPSGNRGTYEQIVDVQPGKVNGEFIFPLGQSGLIQGSLSGVTSIDPNVTSLQPIWRDWRFVPILHVAQDLSGFPSGDSDGDGVLDGYERWYFGDLTHNAGDDDDADGFTLLQEYGAGTDPTDADTDDDGALDGVDSKPQNRLIT